MKAAFFGSIEDLRITVEMEPGPDDILFERFAGAIVRSNYVIEVVRPKNGNRGMVIQSLPQPETRNSIGDPPPHQDDPIAEDPPAEAPPGLVALPLRRLKALFESGGRIDRIVSFTQEQASTPAMIQGELWEVYRKLRLEHPTGTLHIRLSAVPNVEQP